VNNLIVYNLNLFFKKGDNFLEREKKKERVSERNGVKKEVEWRSGDYPDRINRKSKVSNTKKNHVLSSSLSS